MYNDRQYSEIIGIENSIVANAELNYFKQFLKHDLFGLQVSFWLGRFVFKVILNIGSYVLIVSNHYQLKQLCVVPFKPFPGFKLNCLNISCLYINKGKLEKLQDTYFLANNISNVTDMRSKHEFDRKYCQSVSCQCIKVEIISEAVKFFYLINFK